MEPKETSTYAEMQVNCWRMEKGFGAELQRVSMWRLAQTRSLWTRAMLWGHAQPLRTTSQGGSPAGLSTAGASASIATWSMGIALPVWGNWKRTARDAWTHHSRQHLSLYVLCPCFGGTRCSTLLHDMYGYIVSVCIYTDMEFLVLFDGQI